MITTLNVFKKLDCGPCKMSAGVIQYLTTSRPEMKVTEYYVGAGDDDADILAMSYGISAYPSFVKEDDNGNIDVFIGLKRKKAYDEWLDN